MIPNLWQCVRHGLRLHHASPLVKIDYGHQIENGMTTVGLEPTTSRLEVHTSTTELPSPDALLAGKSVCATTHIYIVAPAGRDLFFAGRVHNLHNHRLIFIMPALKPTTLSWRTAAGRAAAMTTILKAF